MFARTTPAPVVGPPLAGAAQCAAAAPADLVAVVAGGHGREIAVQDDRAGLGQLPRGHQTRVVPLGPVRVVGQLAVEVGRVREVVAHAARRSQPDERRAHAIHRQARLLGQVGGVDPGLPGQQYGDQLGVRRGVVGGERLQYPALTGEAARGVGRQRQREPHAGEHHLPGTRGRRAFRHRAVHPQRRRVPKDALKRDQPLRTRQADGPRHRPRRRPQGLPGGNHPLGAPRSAARGTGQRPQEPDGLRRRELRPQIEGGGGHLGLGETPQPPVRQRNLLLHDTALRRGHRHLLRPHPQMQRIVARYPRKRLAQRIVHIHIGRAVPRLRTVQAVPEDVQAGVHPAAAGERLEAQPVAVSRHHRVQRGQQRPLVVARGRHVRHREQPAGRDPGRGEETLEEPGMRLGAAWREAARCLQAEQLPGLRGLENGRT